jgi:YidC/Oxa1 family membrane protein insertase
MVFGSEAGWESNAFPAVIRSVPAGTIPYQNAMSQAQNPKNNLMTTLLLAATIFLGIQLFTGGTQRTVETRTSDQIFANMQKMNREILDVSIVAEYGKYEGKLKEEAKAKNIPQKEVDQKLLQAFLLKTHTSAKAGTAKKEIGRLNTAFTQLDPKHRAMMSNPDWKNVKVAVAPVKGYPMTEVSGDSLYNQIVFDLSAMNKKDLVWGFIPGYQLIDFFVNLTGANPNYSYTLAAFLLALVVRAIVFPLAQKQLMFGRQMMQLQPLSKEIKEKYTDKKGQMTDQVAFQQESMQLYRDYGINPAAGCAPALAQLPLFLIVFNAMLHYRFEFTKGTFLWVNSGMSAQYPWLIAPNLGGTDWILNVIYGISMIIATWLQPVSDPNNAKQQRMIGLAVAVFVTFSMFIFPFPCAFVLYWIFLNIFSTAQSLVAYRIPIPPLQKVATVAGGIPAKSGFFAKLMEEQQRIAQEQMEQKNGAAKTKLKPEQPQNGENGKGNGSLYNPGRGKSGKKKNKSQ